MVCIWLEWSGVTTCCRLNGFHGSVISHGSVQAPIPVKFVILLAVYDCLGWLATASEIERTASVTHLISIYFKMWYCSCRHWRMQQQSMWEWGHLYWRYQFLHMRMRRGSHWSKLRNRSAYGFSNSCRQQSSIYKVRKVTWLTFYLDYVCVWVFACLFVCLFVCLFASFSSFWSGITVCRYRHCQCCYELRILDIN